MWVLFWKLSTRWIQIVYFKFQKLKSSLEKIQTKKNFQSARRLIRWRVCSCCSWWKCSRNWHRCRWIHQNSGVILWNRWVQEFVGSDTSVGKDCFDYWSVVRGTVGECEIQIQLVESFQKSIIMLGFGAICISTRFTTGYCSFRGGTQITPILVMIILIRTV